MMRQHIKLSAVLLVVVLALTGFSTAGRSHASKGKSRSKGSSSSSGGGGCSSSKKSNNDYRHSDYGRDDYDSGSSSSSSSGGTAPEPSASDAPSAYVFRCASPGRGKRKAVTASTVRLTANATGSHRYEVDVDFLDAGGRTIDSGEADVTAEGGETKTVSVRMDNPRKVSKVRKCRVEAELIS